MTTLNNALIFGATSSIAYETAKHFAQSKTELFLVARDKEKLDTVANDLRVRGAVKVHTFAIDANDLARYDELLLTAQESLGNIEAVLIAHAAFNENSRLEQDRALLIEEFSINATSTIALLALFADYFEKRRSGTLAVISSVAGDRGRQSNYVYGSAKAAVSIFAQGLRNRLSKYNIHVLTIKPGLVDTPLTTDIPKNFLFSPADKIGSGIYKAMHNPRKDVVYLPWFWRPVMLVIKLIPEFIFKRLSL